MTPTEKLNHICATCANAKIAMFSTSKYSDEWHIDVDIVTDSRDEVSLRETNTELDDCIDAIYKKTMAFLASNIDFVAPQIEHQPAVDANDEIPF